MEEGAVPSILQVKDEYWFVVEEFVSEYEKFKKVDAINQDKREKRWKKIMEEYHQKKANKKRLTKDKPKTLSAEYREMQEVNHQLVTDDESDKMASKKQFKRTVAKGIPRLYRADAWWYFSGAAKKKQVEDEKRQRRYANSGSNMYADNAR
jgi:hypothetical protein